jgi:hypothetical protein
MKLKIYEVNFFVKFDEPMWPSSILSNLIANVGQWNMLCDLSMVALSAVQPWQASWNSEV